MEDQGGSDSTQVASTAFSFNKLTTGIKTENTGEQVDDESIDFVLNGDLNELLHHDFAKENALNDLQDQSVQTSISEIARLVISPLNLLAND